MALSDITADRGPSARTSDQQVRAAHVHRKTRETEVTVRLDLDGSGQGKVNTGLGFFDHMLELLASHAVFDVEVEAHGDLQTGGHHTVEDVGICLGQALLEALGEKRGLRRYGSCVVPMDEALALVAVDISGRPYLAYEGGPSTGGTGGFEASLVPEFFRALVNNARITVHVRVLAGDDFHHIVEALFKGFAQALRDAVARDPRRTEVPSTKGVL